MLNNYYPDISLMKDEVMVWSQMFFDDGSVTRGKYISRSIFDDEEHIKEYARLFLEETNRIEGVIFIWGAGRVYAKRAQLLSFKGSKTLRLRRL